MAALRKAWCQCCITGGGPAGMMLGFLLARAGVDVIVLEQHADFFRDFRGDTIHPSTLALFDQLGLLRRFLELPHQTFRDLRMAFGSSEIRLADFRHLPAPCRFIALMPQWDFLNFLAEQAGAYPTFSLRMATEATGLIEEQGRIAGVRARSDQGDLEIYADLCVAADGRHSTLRERAGMQVRDLGAPMDVLWFRLARRPDAPDQPLGRFGAGQILIAINRGSYWQCGYVIPKGGYEKLRAGGLEAFRGRLVSFVPALAEEVAALATWDEIKLLTVQVDRLERWWRPGLLCIGDAAHAMSPVAGVGVNLAIQDAVAAANVLADPLLDAALGDAHLERIQRRRQWPTALTQRLQLLVQNRVIAGALEQQSEVTPPFAFRLIDRLALLRRIPARLIGLGVRPEHIATRDVGRS
jgi:2-polyprenyl-6-methoxyphenol hydroxylase-like FAD-dependent oxidoreductase